jgi:hypothetical protein
MEHAMAMETNDLYVPNLPESRVSDARVAIPWMSHDGGGMAVSSERR